MKLLLRAPTLTRSGYGTHARQLASWLLNRNKNFDAQLLPWGDTSWHIDRDDLDGLVGKIMERSKPVEQKYDVTLQLQLPHEWDSQLGNRNYGFTAGVETDVCSPSWIDDCNRMTGVVVPSEFVANMLKRTAQLTKKTLTTPIHVVHEYWGNHLDHPVPVEIAQSSNFNFLIVGQMTGRADDDRKNTIRTLHALMDEFKCDPDVGIILKTNFVKSSLIDAQICTNLLAESIKTHRQHSAFPKVSLLHGHMTDQEMAGIYRNKNVRCLVSLTAGESWGLPIMEAAACGLPVIATDWSAYKEYLPQNSWIPVKSNLVAVPATRVDNRIFVRGARWARPDIDDFRKIVRKFYSDSAYRQTAIDNATSNVSALRDSLSTQRAYDAYDRIIT